MRVFVVNSGSSSIKYRLIETETGESVEQGQVERIGVAGSDVADHAEGMRRILDGLGDTPIDAVGHRIVQGGDRYRDATVVDDAVERGIDELSSLAPLHNPANLTGIRAAREALPGVPQVAVFDTAFHATLPPEAYTYAIDADLAAEHGIRRYGFHGTSVQYVVGRAAEVLGRPLPGLRLVVLHLGNGASATAVRDGASVDTSMGLTPLEGLVMGTRSGDVDPSVLTHLQRTAGMSADEIDQLLNRRSGLLGLTGHSDMRDVRAAADAGDEAARRALGVVVHRLRKYIGAYAAVLGGLDAIVFTAGVGENSPWLRRDVVAGLGFLGLRIDDASNEERSSDARVVSPPDASVPVLVVPTNEELEIARRTAAAVAG